VIDRDGARLADYRKCHLFGEIDRAVFVTGDRLVVQFSLDDLTVGLLTCYDVEFPEAVRAHALAGADLLVVPTGLIIPFDLVSEVLVPARAYGSQVFIAYVNRCGVEGELTYCGSSCVAAPDGRVLVRAGSDEELLVVDVDRDVLLSSRVVNTHLQDRRPELYRDDAP
jgi:predicted amidohydrolase